MMQPSFLPKELEVYADSSIDSDEMLFKKLASIPQDLLSYFEVACDDEMWVNSHPEFMEKAIDWFTTQYYNDKLTLGFAKRAADALRKHRRYLEKFIHANKRVSTHNGEIDVNTLLLATISEPIHEGFLRCKEKHAETLILKELTLQEFELLNEYALAGEIQSLWKNDLNGLTTILELAFNYDVEGLLRDTQLMMCKYVTVDNVLDLLKLSINKRWLIVKEKCLEVINDLSWGFTLSSPYLEGLIIRFNNFSTVTLEHFAPLAPLVTEVSCCGPWINAPAFSKIMKDSPQLRGVNLSHTPEWISYFSDIPKKVIKLDLSYCEWLTSEHLGSFSEYCPNLEELNLESNNQLDFSAWGTLLKFKGLQNLNLTRCHHISDVDLKIILQACPELTALDLSDCRKITEEGFFDLAENEKRITNLNLNRTHISDAALVSIGSRCSGLLSLSIARCNDLSEKGVIGLLKTARKLEELNIEQLHFSSYVTEAAKLLNPRLRFFI